MHPLNNKIILGFSFLLLLSSFLHAEDNRCALKQEDTMLMFVGEDLDVLSIASRREESAWQAPAVAQVISREQIQERAIKNLSQALNMVPGFYMGQKEWGTLPYLRGIPNSILFLYDTVPMGSDTRRTLNQLDYELSLASIKRIEIVRGPGSVLWGPDAFAGIVNVVPMTGKDLDGFETGILYQTPGDQKAFYVNWGNDRGSYDTFLSVSGRRGREDDCRINVTRFWNNLETPAAYEEGWGDRNPGDARYLEASGHFSYKDWLTVTGRVSDSRTPYAISLPEDDLTWRESRRIPTGFIKLEAKKTFDPSSGLRFTGSLSSMSPEFEIIDRVLKQSERNYYFEGIYDRSFSAGRGLLTTGLSYREKRIKDAPIWDGSLPTFLSQENEGSWPILTLKDYNTRLFSIFGQYTRKFNDVDVWFGLRNDAHDTYQDHLSYNTGLSWSPADKWIIKLLYGSAYRTPFARQLIEEEKPDLEKINSLSAQISWKPSVRTGLSVVGFSSQIQNHIIEDPYERISLPNHQDIYGAEIEGTFSPINHLNFSANLTVMDNRGPDETYHVSNEFFIRPDGSIVPIYEDFFYPYDTGPKRLFNLTGTWQPLERLTMFFRLGYFSSRKLIDLDGEKCISTPGIWLLDMSTTVRDFIFPGVDLQISFQNLMDKRFDTPGTYTTIDGEPLSAIFILRKKW